MKAQTQWQLSGNAAQTYQDSLVPAVFSYWTPILVARTQLKQGERVLDLACGTGVVARLAAQQVGKTGFVVGLDLNSGMLDVARSQPTLPGGTSIVWQEGSALDLPFPDASFDVVLCQQGLQYFPDSLASLKEVHRVLRAAGRLALGLWGALEHSPGYAALVEALDNFIPEASPVLRTPFSFSDTEKITGLLVQENFQQINLQTSLGSVHFASPDDFVMQMLASSPAAAVVALATDDTRSALISQVRAKLQPYMKDNELAFPIEAHIVTAQA
jgi:ubiquinone/menaquinone biosynthesis C-methylase UbiE